MNINPSYETIGSIFEKNILLEVPKYQRYYAWDDEQVDDFIKDISTVYTCFRGSQETEHFFGGIVVVKKNVPGSNRQQRELIDGQQRITTTILLIISVIRKFESLKTPANREIIQPLVDKLKEKYLNYRDRINRQPVEISKLVLSNADRQYFEDIISNQPLVESRNSHKMLKKAFQKLTSFVNKTVDSIADFDSKIDALSDIDNIIHNENISIEHIDAQSPAGSAIFTGEDIHKLKNLTLLTPTENDHASNMNYVDKKSIYLSSEYKLNTFFADIDSWNAEVSVQWAEHLADMACKIFVV